MITINNEFWQLDIPDDWQTDKLEDAVSLFDPAKQGTLLISTVVQSEPVTEEDLVDMATEHIEAGAEFFDAEFGEFVGVTCCYELEAEYWCEWYLSADNVILFVTYNCPLANEGEEDDMIESILESLRAAKHVH